MPKLQLSIIAYWKFCIGQSVIWRDWVKLDVNVNFRYFGRELVIFAKNLRESVISTTPWGPPLFEGWALIRGNEYRIFLI